MSGRAGGGGHLCRRCERGGTAPQQVFSLPSSPFNRCAYVLCLYALQESLGFSPGAGVLAAVAASVQALRARRRAAAAGRQRLISEVSTTRCAVAPLLGRDTLTAATVLHPVAHVHLISHQVQGGWGAKALQTV